MLSLLADRQFRDCDGATRRDFLKIGALGCGALTLPMLLESRAKAAQAGRETKESSVVWLWLGGGPSHVETFDPKMSAPAEFRSVTGEVASAIPGVTFGTSFPNLATMADRMAIVRSFAHRNSGHRGGTHWVMTGFDNRNVDNGGAPTHPAIGAIAAKARGANHPVTGMPTYCKLSNIGADGPAFLGTAYGPFDPQGQASKNLTISTKLERLDDRRELLTGLDRFRRDADASGLMEGLDDFESQAFNLILGKAPDAFNLKNEDPKTVDKYGPGLGQSLLSARRLCEAGCGFVTINYGGWDMHAGIKAGFGRRAPQLDHAVATFLQDVGDRGLDKRILLLISGEFGRTPRINRNAGRDHWAPLSTLALAGGGLRMGQVIGESSSKAEQPRSRPISPEDLMATLFQVLGIDSKLQTIDQAGRPVYLLPGGEPIRELA